MSIFRDLIDGSIEINSVYYPKRHAFDALERFTDPALYVSPNTPDTIIGLGGTITKIRLIERFYGVLTQHQLDRGSFEVDQVCIQGREKHIVATSAGVHLGTNGKIDDIAVFDFTGPVLKGPLGRADWIDMNRHTSCGHEDTVLLTAIGFSGDLNAINYDTNSYSAVPYAVHGTPIQPYLKERKALKLTKKPEFKLEGMSGGAVYSFSYDDDKLKMHLAGIITNGSGEIVHYTPTEEFLPPLMDIIERNNRNKP